MLFSLFFVHSFLLSKYFGELRGQEVGHRLDFVQLVYCLGLASLTQQAEQLGVLVVLEVKFEVNHEVLVRDVFEVEEVLVGVLLALFVQIAVTVVAHNTLKHFGRRCRI
jgi:hypothetical protein